MTALQDIFISYGRIDSKEFAEYLHGRLVAQGYTVWFDFDAIPQGVDYEKQISDGIEKVDNFVFIISPHSTNSPHCLKEIEQAVALNKRLVPIMHVEQISRETWQTRHPDKGDDDWANYCASGQQSCFTHMHPEIEKINWNQVDFSDAKNFESAFQALVELFEQERAYVHQHTELLNQALIWQRNQKQRRYLLIGEERQQAEAWLKTKFKDKQPPCIPTDLHCEFIVDSIKNANNLMTQVFLCHDEQDRDIAGQVQRTLMRAGITTWTHHDDIEFGSDLQTSMVRGMEEADNAIFLISPHSLTSAYCQKELNHALSLNKRIIPMLAEEVIPEQIPASLQTRQYINLIDNCNQVDYQKDESDLLRILKQDATYYNEHKVLLAKALKWQRQQRNPCILLRGYELQHALAWLKLSKQYPDHGPTTLQTEFIVASERQPSGISLDVFVSYSRADSDFARNLNDGLQRQGKRTWFDQESIASGADFQQEIYRGIETSDHFLFILSPSSVNSPYCADEVEYAAKLNKRIVTVRHRAVETAELHSELAKVQWIDFQKADFTDSFQELIRILDQDPEHLSFHTQLLMQAIKWDRKNQRESLLLRGDDLTEAEQWLLKATSKRPLPTALQGSYVAASRRTSANRQRRWIGALSILLALAVTGGVIARVQSQRAAKLQKLAQQEQQEAEIVAQSLATNNLALSNLNIEALVNGIKTARDVQKSPEQISPDKRKRAAASLRKIVYSIKEKNRFNGHTGGAWGVAFSPDGAILASTGKDKTVKLWQRDGTLIQTLTGHSDTVWNVSFSPDGQTLASASNDGTVRLWKSDGTFLKKLGDGKAVIWEVKFSPDGQLIASANHDGTVGLWTSNGTLIGRLEGHEAGVWDVNFSPDSQLIASASVDKTVRLWQRDGTLITVLKGHEADVGDVAFSPDSQILASASGDGDVRLWQRDGSPIATLTGHTDFVRDIRFSPDGETLASAGDDGIIRLWQRDGTPITTLTGHTDTVGGVYFSPDGQTIASASWDNTMRVWQLVKTPVTKTLPIVETPSIIATPIATLAGHLNRVWALDFSPDGKTIASASIDGTVRLWEQDGIALTRLESHETVENVRFSPDGQLIASTSKNEVQLWQRDGTPIATLEGHKKVVWDIRFSPDSQTLATASDDGTVRLWRRDGTLITILKGHKKGVGNVGFSPDGQLIATASGDSTVRLWQRNGTLTASLIGHQESVQKVRFSPDSQTLISASEDGKLQLWQRNGRLITTMKGHRSGIRDVRFSPDGKTIASASKDNTVRLWQLDGEPIKVLRGHNHEFGVGKVRFSPNGETIASASGDGTIRLWQRDGTRIATLKGHAAGIENVRFSPDGQTVASASADKTVRLWQRDGIPIATLQIHGESVEDIDVSPDGKTIVSASLDKTVILWNFDLDNLVAQGCDWLDSYLSNPETPQEDKDICSNI